MPKKTRRGRIRLRAMRGKLRAIRRRIPRRSATPRVNNFGVAHYRYLVAVPILLLCILAVCLLKWPPMCLVKYQPVADELDNPLMGWAVDAREEPETVEVDHTLVYAQLSWRDFEPTKGAYDFDSFERAVHWSEWLARGKRFILRFVMDAPGDEAHFDIPQWLLDEMGEAAGMPYATDTGSGFSPNYADLPLQSYHRQAIEALGARYDGDPGVAFVEIGSLGHNGEWWVDREGGVEALPLSSDATTFLWHYTRAFSNTALLARLPYYAVRSSGIGLYNPRLGDAEDSWAWLDLVELGGYDDQIDMEIRGVGSVSEGGPVGAHLARGAEEPLSGEADELVSEIRDCAVTYVAGLPARYADEAARDGARRALSAMGYRLWIRRAAWPSAIRSGYRLSLETLWVNDGVAAMARDWPIELSLCREGEALYTQRVEAGARSLAPGDTRLMMTLDVPPMWEGTYDLCVAILDPDTGEPAVALAMDAPESGRRYALGELRVTR